MLDRYWAKQDRELRRAYEFSRGRPARIARLKAAPRPLWPWWVSVILALAVAWAFR